MGKRFTFTIHDDLEEELETLSEHLNTSQADVLRRSIALLDYVETVKQEGGTAFVEDEDGNRREIVLL